MSFARVLPTIALTLLAGCATVDVTKTAKGFFDPTRPDDVDILMSVPGRPFTELATVSTTNWNPNETAKMHNAIRAKTAPLGAHAVILTDSGIVVVRNSAKLWSTGFALRFADSGKPAEPPEQEPKQAQEK